MFQKTNISCLLMHTRTRGYQGVRNVSFSENSAYALNVPYANRDLRHHHHIRFNIYFACLNELDGFL